MSRRPNKKRFKPGEVQFLEKNWLKLTNQELLDHLNAQRKEDDQLKMTWLRDRMYERGMKRCKILIWKPDEYQFLLDHYQTEGDVWIAGQLAKKRKAFTNKKVEKKRKLEGLVRTPEQVKAIRKKNAARGVYNTAHKGRWKNGGAPDKDRRIWKVNGVLKEFIKVEGAFKPYPRWLYERVHGKVPMGYKVYHIDCNPLNNDISNLEIRKGSGSTIGERRRSSLHNRNNLRKKENSGLYAKKPAPEALPASPGDQKVRVRINPKLEVLVAPGTSMDYIKTKYAAYIK